MLRLTESRFDGVDCSIYLIGEDTAYGITLDTAVTIAGNPKLFSKAYKILHDKPRYAPFLLSERVENKQISFVTPEGVLLLAEELQNDALYRLHGWMRRAAHKLARYEQPEEPDNMLHAPSILESAEEQPVVYDEITKEIIKLIERYDSAYPWRQWVNMIADLYLLTSKSSMSREFVLRDVEKIMTNVYGFVSIQSRREMVEDKEAAMFLPDFIEITGEDAQWRAITSAVLLAKLHGDNIPEMQAPKRKETKTITELLAILEPLAEARNDKSPHHINTMKEVCARMARDEGVDWKRSATRYKNKYGVTDPSKTDLILDSTTRYYAFKRVVKCMLAEAKKGESQ